MDEGQNLNNGGSGLGAAGGFDAFQNGGGMDGGVGAGGFGAQGPIIGNDSGDIVLSSGGDSDGGGKSKRGLMIALVAVVVVAVVAVGAFAMWKGGVFGGEKSGSNSASPSGMSAKDSFGNYYKLLRNGLYDVSANGDEWFYFGAVESGDATDYEKKYLSELRKYYEGFMVFANGNDAKIVKYDQIFQLYNNLANRFEIIDSISEMDSLDKGNYIDELTKMQDDEGVLAELALAENNYFRNYYNGNGADYLARAINLVGLTKSYFENLTNEIYRELGGADA